MNYSTKKFQWSYLDRQRDEGRKAVIVHRIGMRRESTGNSIGMRHEATGNSKKRTVQGSRTDSERNFHASRILETSKCKIGMRHEATVRFKGSRVQGQIGWELRRFRDYENTGDDYRRP